jgi:lysozyme
MQFSEAGYDLLKKSEGFRSQAYTDLAGFATIGYGHRIASGESFPNGITEQTAETLLQTDVGEAEEEVTRLVKVSLTQGQFDALVDFVFNLGAGRLQSSTLLLLLNEGNYDAAAQQLLLWDHSGTKEVIGLKLRREAECSMFTGEPDEDPEADTETAQGAEGSGPTPPPAAPPSTQS